MWEGRAPQIERTLFWRSGSGAAKQTAVRRGDWKLVVDGPHTYVFNLRTDLSERNDLAKSAAGHRAGAVPVAHELGSDGGRRGEGA